MAAHTFKGHEVEVLAVDGTKTRISEQGIEFWVPSTQVKEKKEPKRRISMQEWTDPLTGEVHECPTAYLQPVKELSGMGSGDYTLASVILEKMGEKDTESNKRHIRAAALYWRHKGVPILSVKSGKGGYFIAQTKQEVMQWVEVQRTSANSMLAEADFIEKEYVTLQ
jgi:hypothetical protein